MINPAYKPLFFENIEAWINGPVVRELYNCHRGIFTIKCIPLGNSDLLNNTQKETIDAVVKFYGDKPAQYLIDLTHSENPWIETRKGISDSDRSTRIVSLDLIQQYYSSIKL